MSHGHAYRRTSAYPSDLYSLVSSSIRQSISQSLEIGSCLPCQENYLAQVSYDSVV
jgi:hypothetical protein